MTDTTASPGSANVGLQAGFSFTIPNNSLLSASVHLRPDYLNVGGHEAIRGELAVKLTNFLPYIGPVLNRYNLDVSATGRISYFGAGVAVDFGGKLSRAFTASLPTAVQTKLKGSNFAGLRALYLFDGTIALQAVVSNSGGLTQNGDLSSHRPSAQSSPP